jgi:hypothetical protein
MALSDPRADARGYMLSRRRRFDSTRSARNSEISVIRVIGGFFSDRFICVHPRLIPFVFTRSLPLAVLNCVFFILSSALLTPAYT